MQLEKMTLNELWDLFPIVFVLSTPDFVKIYEEEAKNLKVLLESLIKRISHIGSTAIPNIKTKPIIDILIEIDFTKKEVIKAILLNNGYLLMQENINKISFNKGYTEKGYADKVFHIHLKNYGDCDELYFRDYLVEHPKKAQDYEKLKLDLYNLYKPNRDLYTEGKKEFVSEIVNLSKKKYKNKY